MTMEINDSFVQALLQLGYNDYVSLTQALDKGNRRCAKSIWGKLSVLLFGKNRPNKRTSICLKWTKNKAQLLVMIKEKMQTKSGELDKVDTSFEKLDQLVNVDKLDSLVNVDKLDSLVNVDKLDSLVNVDKSDSLDNVDKSDSFVNADKSDSLDHVDRLVVNSERSENVIVLSDLSSAREKAVDSIRANLATARANNSETSNTAIATNISVGMLKQELCDDGLFRILATSCDLKLAQHCAPDMDHTENVLYYNTLHTNLWFDAVEYYGLKRPEINKTGYSSLTKVDCDECDKFVSFMNNLNIKLIKRNSCLLEVWLINENVSCDILKIFSNCYIAISSSELKSLILFLRAMRISVLENKNDFILFQYYDLYLTSIKKFDVLPAVDDCIYSSDACSVNMSLVSEEDFPSNYYQLNFDSDLNSVNNLINRNYDQEIEVSSIGSGAVVEVSKGEFLLSLEEWNSFAKIFGNSVIFSKDWTDMFNSKLEDKFICVLCFKYKHLNKINSRKSSSSFFNAKAVCKFSNCLKFHFFIYKEPFTSKASFVKVEYIVSGTLSSEHSNSTVVYSRKLSNSRRLQVATEVTQKSTAKYYYEQFPSSENTELALNYGNFNKIKSKGVLRRAKFDLSSVQRFSNDNWSELSGLQQYYRNLCIGTHLNGYIQSLCHDPFVIHMYTEDQINILKYFRKSRATLHFDATGSVIRKIDSSQKKVFYYALTLRHPEVRTSPIPLGEMIGAGHTTAEISYFLHKWSLTAKKILGGEINIGHIEIDYSWALIHSVCNVFIKSDLDSYLTKCWNKVESYNGEGFVDFNVVLHLCSSHLIHGIGFNINKKFKLAKKVRQLFLHSIGYMIRCADLSLISNVFNSLCNVFLNKFGTDNLKTHLLNLESFICDGSSNICDENSEFEYDEISDPSSESKTYRDRSPFGKYFSHIYETCRSSISTYNEGNLNNININDNKNPYYYPGIIDYLLTYYLPLVPLWSGIILGPATIGTDNKITHFSNAVAENWMRVVKIDILQSKTCLRPGDFIRMLYPSITNRLAAFRFAFHPRATKVFTKYKRSRSVLEQDCEEEWARKNKKHCGYLFQRKMKFPLDEKSVSSAIKNKCSVSREGIKKVFVPRTRRKISELRTVNKKSENSSIHQGIQTSNDFNFSNVSVVTDSDLVEMEVVKYILPGFRPPHGKWQVEMCRRWNLSLLDKIVYNNTIASIGEKNLMDYVPDLIQHIAGDGNCYFRTISHLLTGSQSNYGSLRSLLIGNMLGKLKTSCNKFLRTKYVYQQSNYRSVQDWINKTGMNKDGKWATDLEVFATALLLNIDIWVYLGSAGTRWVVFSGKGFGLDEALKNPTATGLYIQNMHCHYEPILAVKYSHPHNN